MTFSPAAATRQLMHRHQIDILVFARDDGPWAVDDMLSDTKALDSHIALAIRPEHASRQCAAAPITPD